jgi:hypothetical protein
MRGLALGWTAHGMTATQRRYILASPRERIAWVVPRSHCLPSWENPRVSPLALPALAEAEEGAPPAPAAERVKATRGNRRIVCDHTNR